MKVLITGGTGYIGSHTCVELLNTGHEVIIVDNLSNSKESVVDHITEITGKRPAFYCQDLKDENALNEVFDIHNINAVIHFAGFKAVGESVRKPIKYYDNNINSTLTLCRVMKEHNCKNIIFSSSATVYGENGSVPFLESTPKGRCTNPYGWTKWMIEQILTDIYISDNSWNVVLLRYFNPIGAHPSGLLGEDPNGVPTNLVPYIAQVAEGKLEKINVFGNDYNTPDGTGIRDYIHVVDLAAGHMKAIEQMEKQHTLGIKTYNLGTGKGYSVLEVIKAFEEVCERKLPYEVKPRRTGDIDVSYCEPTLASKELGWKAKYDLKDMCLHVWKWQQNK